MLTENRKFHFVGELLLKRSHVLDDNSQPKDDRVNWLFLKFGKRQFGFVYKIKNPLHAIYGQPFKVELSFSMIEEVVNIVKLNHSYEVLRGEESIGKVSLTNFI